MVKKRTNLLERIFARLQIRFIYFLIILTAMVALAGVIWLVVLIKPMILPAQVVAEKKDCASCHSEIYAGWHISAHSDTESKGAMSQGSNCVACHKEMPNQTADVINQTPSFSDFWVKKEMPIECAACHVTGYDKATNTRKSDGISCEACHGVIPENHPDAAVSVEKAEANCNTCHTSDRFDWGKWKNSVHFQNSLTCTDCHNPHTTSLKTSGGAHGATDSSLCENCHKDLTKTSEHSIHAEANITCIDCHLGDPSGNDDFHKMPDHDFKPNIETCSKCHADQMHSSGEAKTIPPPAFSRVTSIALKNNDASVKTLAEILPNPIRFLVVAMVFGVVGGVSLRKSIFRRKK